jgi:prepilin-type N-terminal cleavage/methylation domain-containing protein
MNTPRDATRRGFTLVELLVVIAIIALLIAILMPAVQSSRESARRIQCMNNMKQLGLALQTYHSSMGAFPPAITTQGAGSSPVAHTGSNVNLWAGWTIAVLPYLEEQGLFDAFDLAKPISDTVNRLPRSTKLSVMNCPSEPNASQACSRAGGDWARGNYGANIGMLGPQETTRNGAATNLWIPTMRGVMGANEALTIAQIRDGTSQTMLVLELRSGLAPRDIRGTWAMGQCGASSVCVYGSNVGSATPGPNVCSPEADDQNEGDTVVNFDIGEDRARRECMFLKNSPNWQSFPRSSHVNGIVVGFADGSVHFISDYIESANNLGSCGPRGPCNSSRYLTWQRLIVSGDGQDVGGSMF